MTLASTITSAPSAADDGRRLTWSFRVDEAQEESWDWARRGSPPVNQLAPVRTPRSSASNRHIPVTAYSMTNGGVVHVESGLEHDLVRKLDRDSSVMTIVAQPLRLSWATPKPASHIPDLLTRHDDDAVTVWDVRALEEQDEDFRNTCAITREACAVVGWCYGVFSGLGQTERLNLLWLHGFRRRPVWTDRFEEEIRHAAGTRQATIGSLFALDDGTGELKAVVWHLLWLGALAVDMTVPWTTATNVAVGHD